MKPKVIKRAALTPNEIDLLARFEYEGKEVYTRADIIAFCDDEKKADYLIRKLLIKNRLKTIVQNVYLFIPMKAPHGRWTGNEFLIAKAIARGADYYIGYASVFNSYGFTQQIAQMIYVVNVKYSLVKKFGATHYKFIRALPDRMYGLETRRINREDVIFASKERALVDCFEFYDTKKAKDILTEQYKSIDMDVFVDYVVRYPVQVIRRRLGYFLDQLGVAQKLLNKIAVGTKGYSFLFDSALKKGKINNRWRVIVNG